MSDKKQNNVEERLVNVFSQVAKTSERIGVLIGTFVAGVLALFISAIPSINISNIHILGFILIIASLIVYCWQISRNTIRVISPPPPIQPELKEIIDWMKLEISNQNN